MSHFNNAANTWDSPDKIKSMSILAQDMIERIGLKLNEELDILDFGCGTGLLGLEFIQYAKTITGVDTSEGMLDVFNKKVIDHDHINSLRIDLELTELNKTFDLVVSAMAFHHLTSPDKVLLKLSKMLNEGGRIAIVDLETEDGSFHPRPMEMGVKHFGFSKQELESWAKEAGLKVDVSRIATKQKNDRDYHQFLAVFTK